MYVGGNLTGNFVNSGVIEGLNSTNVTGSGASGGSAFAFVGGVNIEGTLNGNFTNSANATISSDLTGNINGYTSTGRSQGFSVGNFFGDNFTNSGTIYGDNSANIGGHFATGSAVGIAIYDSFEGNFTNAGNVSAALSGNIGGASAAGYAIGFGAFNANFDGAFTNTGTIGATSSAYVHGRTAFSTAAGVGFGNFFGTFTNSATGSLQADLTSSANIGGEYASAYANGFAAEDFSGTFANAGNIGGTNSANIGGYSALGEAAGVAIGTVSSGLFSGTFSNTGNIQGTVDGNIGGHNAQGIATGVYAYSFNGDFNNNGTITGTESANISGFFTGNVSGTAAGVFINQNFVGGNFTNSGSITGNLSGNISGDVSGVGVGVYVGDFSGATFTNTGNITGINSANITQGGNITLQEAPNPDISSTALVTSISGCSRYTACGGADGVYAGSFTGAFINSGNITGINSAYIYSEEEDDPTGWAAGVYVAGNFVGSYMNSGNVTGNLTATIVGFSSYGSAYGLYVGGNFDGNFTNSGNVSGLNSANVSGYEYAEAYAYGVYINDDFIGNFNNNGTIAGVNNAVVGGTYSGGSAEYAEAYAYGVEVDDPFYGNFTNSGNIIGNVSANVSGYYEAYSQAYGFLVDDEFSGNFTNSGNIAAVNSAVVGGAYYYGSAEYAEASAYGVYIDGNFTGNFTNSGSVTGNVTGNVSAYEYGYAEAYGVYIDDNFQGGNFTNSGTIAGVSNAVVGGSYDYQGSGPEYAYASGYGVYVDGNFTGNFTNSGSISGTEISDVTAYDYAEAYGYGVYVDGNFTGNFANSGNISGFVGGNISTYYADIGAVGVEVDGNFTGNFTNSGNITGYIDNSNISAEYYEEYYGYGVYIDGNFTGNFTNTGFIGGSTNGVYITGNMTGDFDNLCGQIVGYSGAGVQLNGSLVGNFTNTGKVIGYTYDGYYDYGLVINGDMLGDFTNKGYMSVYDGTPGAGWSPNTYENGFAAYIGGNFTGNITTVFGQGLYVDHTANIQGKTLSLWVNQYVPTNQTFTILEAGTLLADPSYNITSSSPLLSATATVSGDEVEVTSSRNLISTVSASVGGGHLGLGPVLDAVVGSGANLTTQEWQLLNLLYSQTSALGVGDTLLRYSPVIRDPIFMIYGNEQQLVDAIQTEQQSYFGLTPAAPAPVDASALPTKKGPIASAPLPSWTASTWVSVVGANSHLANDGLMQGYDATTWGVMGGVQAGFYNGFSGGVALGYLDTTGGGWTVQSIEPAAYARFGINGFYADGLVSGGFHNISQSNNGYLSSSGFNATDIGVRGEIGYDFRFGGVAAAPALPTKKGDVAAAPYGGWTLTPFAAINWRTIQQDSYNDPIAAPAAPCACFASWYPGVWTLAVASNDYTFTTWELGGRVSGLWGPIGITASAGYRGDVDQTKGTTMAALAGIPAFGTTVWGDVSGAFGNLDLTYRFTPAMSATVSVSGLAGKDYNYGSVRGALNWSF